MKRKLLLWFFGMAIAPIWSQTIVPFHPTVDASGIFFGIALDIDGDEIIASSQSEVNSNNVGKVYLFGINGNAIEQKQVFYPDDVASTDAFGYSISIQNDFIAVGVPDHDAIALDAGAVYIYHKVNSQYEFFQKLTVPDGVIRDFFGNNVKLYNNNLFVAADGYGLDASFGNGAVYVYHFDGTSWVFSERLTVQDTDAFGRKIDVENNTLVISSDQMNNAIHTFDWDGTHWTYSNSIGSALYVSDFSLANNQLHLLTSNNTEPSVVTVLSRSNGNWIDETTINPPNEQLMLTAIEVDGDQMYLGANTDWSGLLHQFPVFRYTKNEANWVSQPSLFSTNESTEQQDSFGFSIASKGGKLVIGAPFEETVGAPGKVYYITNPLGIDAFNKKSIVAYPNPTKGIVNLETTSDHMIESADVYDISGKLLLSQIGNSQKVSLENLASGIYFMRLQSQNNKQETFKIIKN